MSNPALSQGAWQRAGDEALSGGFAGASAMVLQVVSLMWLRTVISYQHCHGTTATQTIRTLYAEGGVRRFYRGFTPALVQGPLLRFGNMATNAGVLSLFDSSDQLCSCPVSVKTALSSTFASGMRIAMMPVDTAKTALMVHGASGVDRLRAKYKIGGSSVLFHGAMASSAATFAAHYPWFTVFNFLNEAIPNGDTRVQKLCRNAGIGFSASLASDAVSNSLRVLKTKRQLTDAAAYSELLNEVVRQDGLQGLFGRGLKTRLIANGIQGIAFSVLYKLFEEWYRI
jgi:hypothetical protein